MNALDYLGRIVTVAVDRPLGSRHPKHEMVYPVNYGFVPGTVSGDGEELDAYILGVAEPLETFTGRCVGVVRRTTEDDDKPVVAPAGMRFVESEIRNATFFQERYFTSVIHLFEDPQQAPR